MNRFRSLNIIFFFITSVVILYLDNRNLLCLAVLVGFTIHVFVWKSIKRALSFTLPILFFIFFFILLQLISHTFSIIYSLKSLAFFFFSTATIRLFPWRNWILKLSFSPVTYHAMLMILFVWHFINILFSETRRMFQARSLSLVYSYGPGWWRSLVAVLSSIFTRSLIRAERFYAAQWLRGVAE